MQRSEKVWGLCTVIVAGLIAAIVYHSILGIGFGAAYPSNTFLYRAELIFSDFYFILQPIKDGSPLSSKVAVYFPFAYIPFYPLTLIDPDHALALTLFLFSVGTLYFCWSRLAFLPLAHRAIAAGILTFATYAYLISVNRANIEMFVILLIFGFFASLERGKYMWAAVLLACATAMKLYPGAYGVLLLRSRQYKASALTAILTLVLTIASAAAYPGGVFGSLAFLRNNLQYFHDTYVLNPEMTYFSSSYFSVIKWLGRIVGADVPRLAEGIILPYTLSCVIFFVIIVGYILKYEDTLWRQAALLAFALILLPEISFDYKLMHILIPAVLFLSAPAGRLTEDRFYTALFGMLLIPKAYAPIGHETTISVLLNPVLMTVMIAHIMWTRFRREPCAEALT